MSLVEWVAPEAFVDIDELALRTDWSATGSAASVARSVFGITGEKWFNMGVGATAVSTKFTSSTGACEISATLQIDPAASLATMGGPADSLQPIMTLKSLTPEGTDQGLDFTYARQEGIPGNQTYLKFVGGDANSQAPIPNFEVIAGGVYYFTLRVKDSTGAGSDGAFEFWCNGILMNSAYDIDFSYDDPVEIFEVSIHNFYGNITFMRNATVHDAWTTAAQNPPVYKTVLEATELNVISSTNYTNEGGAVSISEALTDYDDDTYISTETANSVASFGFASIPAELASADVLDVGTRSDFARKASGFSTPTITISDTVSQVAHGTLTRSVDVVGDARQRLELSASIPESTTIDTITVSIDSGS